MKKSFIYIGIAVLLAILSFTSYNGLVDKEEAIAGSWANVETQYQRRADLIPNLVNTVKGYADFEKETLTGVIEARSKATSIQLNIDDLSQENIAKFQQAQTQLSGALSRLLVAVERYPDLKANQNFMDLQAQLEGTENRIAVARKKFNELVQVFNARIKKFPTVLFAKLFGFEKKAYFQSEKGTEKAPEVKF